PNAGNARLKLYNVKGQLLEVLADELYSQGKHNLAMDMSEYASGIYILSLESAGKKLQKRITLMK
ncbi:MAG: T9SS type A sorting domain-containing protein, partial [Candidatus Cloacimonetes bacterium]|nr:T9SS type A sorting domain-containing protein [Candidatus Cloacimonadota bacterium]